MFKMGLNLQIVVLRSLNSEETEAQSLSNDYNNRYKCIMM